MFSFPSFLDHSVILTSFRSKQNSQITPLRYTAFEKLFKWLRNEPEWGLNEWIRCGLFRRDHTWFIHSEAIPAHSGVIPWGFRIIDFEWCWNDRMTVEWEVFLASLFFSTSENTLISPHSVIPSSFENAWNGVEWKITSEWYHSEGIPIIFTPFHFIPVSFIIQEWHGMTEWGWNEGHFLKQGKTLNSEISLILPSFGHSSSISSSSHDHSIHLRIIPNSNLNKPAFLSFSLIRVSFNSRMIEGWQNDDEMRETIIWCLKKKGVLR